MQKNKKWSDPTIKRAVEEVKRQLGIEFTPTSTEIKSVESIIVMTDNCKEIFCTGNQLYNVINVNIGMPALNEFMNS